MNIKQFILQGVETIGLNRLARRRTRRRLLGLCYHSIVSDNSPADDARTRIAVTVSQFDEQLRELRRNWNPVSLDQIRSALFRGVSLPDQAVFVSFDDGYRNNLTLAAPLLAKYAVPTTIFVTTGLVGSGSKLIWPLEMHERITVWSKSYLELAGQNYPLAPPKTPQRTYQAAELVNMAKHLSIEKRQEFLEQLRNHTELDLSAPWQQELYEFMDRDEIKSLRSQGIEIGAHTISHPVLSKLDPPNLERELRESKEQIERELATECDALAYPFGSVYDFSDQVVETARRIGFRLAFTLQDLRNTETLDPMRIHRICIHRELSIASFRALISGLRNG